MAATKTVQFDRQLKQALKLFGNLDRLADESVLASAYFLGAAKIEDDKTNDGEHHWGTVLRTAMLAAADKLWGDSPPRIREEIEAAWSDILLSPGTHRYHYLILELRYFRRFFQPRSLQQIWQEFLQQSRAEFYRDVDAAIAALGESLLRHLQPGARHEEPPTSVPLTGRAAEVEQILEIVRADKSVALSGVSGAGKSSLAASVVSAWPSSCVLWFTVRPELSDGLYQFLFAVGGFLHQHGQDLLWRALAANQGKLDDPALLLTLARQDLVSLSSQHPLLVVDEVDIWSNGEDTNRTLLEFIAGLQEVAPLLLVGQRVDLAAHRYVTLTGLDGESTARFLAQQKLQISTLDLRQIQAVTGGNPRLLWLCVELLARGEPLASILDDAPGSVHSFDSFLNLLWQRLDEAEREMMHALSVYPAPAPCDSWPAELLDRLTARHLLFRDARGSVALLPSVRTVLYRALSAEQREHLHHRAAGVCAALGEYTMAAYHFQRADRPDLAVQIWFPHRGSEIERGEAATAAAIFNKVSGTRLKKPVRRALDLIRAELYRLNGDLHAGLATLEATDWREGEPSELAIEAQRLRGDFLDALGFSENALQSYADSLATTARLRQRSVDLHVRRGLVHIRHRQLPDAVKAGQQARCQAEQFQGLVLEEQGELDEAERHYLLALNLAETLDDEVSLAETNRCLSKLYGRRGELERASDHAEHAIAYYRQIGDLVRVALVRSNMAANYLDAGRYAQALTTGRLAFDFLQQIGHSHGIAGTACNLAEASFELGDHAEAERYAQLALDQEEPLAFPYAFYTLALVRNAQGDHDAAQALLRRCASVAQTNEDIFIEAYAWLKLAELLQQGTGAVESTEAAQRALHLFQRLGLTEMAEVAGVIARDQRAKPESDGG